MFARYAAIISENLTIFLRGKLAEIQPGDNDLGSDE